LAWRDEFVSDEKFDDGDEVAERVLLLGELSFPVPAPALLGAAAYMGDRDHEAAVGQRQPVGRERGRNRNAVGAVAVYERRRGAAERRFLAIEQRQRYRFAVEGGSEYAPRHIGARIVSARDLLPLAQPSRAVGEIVVPDLRRRRHRRIAELQCIGLELVSRI